MFAPANAAYFTLLLDCRQQGLFKAPVIQWHWFDQYKRHHQDVIASALSKPPLALTRHETLL